MEVTKLPGGDFDIDVIDCDVHLTTRTPEMRRKISKSLDEPHRSHVDPDTDTYGSPYGGTSWNYSLGGKIEWFKQPVNTAEDVREVCDRIGVKHPIINGRHIADRIKSSQRGVQEVRAVNDIVLEILSEEADFRGLITTRTKNPAEMAEEIDRLGDEDQIVGVFFETLENEKPLGHPNYDVIYRAAEDNDLSVVFHPGSSSNTHFPTMNNGFSHFLGLHSISFPFENMATLASLILEGVPEKFPELNFVILESGLAWVPYMMGRLNREYDERRSEAPLLKQSPEEYIRDRFYFGTQPVEEFNDPAHMDRIMDIMGSEMILFTSDWPHHDFDDVNATLSYFNSFDDTDVKNILHDNAVRAFNLEA